MLSIIIAVIHIIALQLKLYVYLWWLDTVVHILAGIAVVWALVVVGNKAQLSPRARMILIVGGVASTIVLWEIFEYYAGVVALRGYWNDTFSDVWWGMVGALGGWWYAKQYDIEASF